MTQADALSILKTGANVFLTGEPGSGKTHTINQYISYLRSCGIEPAITASTGIAATHVGGFTIHSWSGIGIKNKLTEYDLDVISQNKNVVRRISGAKVLIIDEVSMLSATTLSMVDAVCREVKRNFEPFGGMQVVLVGDFFQLPPIQKRSVSDEDQSSFIDMDAKVSSGFAYESSVWEKAKFVICYLSEQHRQEDSDFLEFLSAIRSQCVEEKHKELLRKRCTPKPKEKITQLYSHNINVDSINDSELSKLKVDTKIFEMESKGRDVLVLALKRGCLSPERLVLKVGAEVMFTKNDIGQFAGSSHRKYVNGTRGVVTGFDKNNNYPIIKIHSGRSVVVEPAEWRIEDGIRVLARITQIPLRLAWAITIHKSQGMSLDSAHMDLSQTFEYGQGYVALSRVRSLSGLYLAGLNDRALEIHPEVFEKDLEFKEKSKMAEQNIIEINSAELEKIQNNFVKACGGQIGAGRHKKTTVEKIPTQNKTSELLKDKKTFEEIAKERDMTLGTIIGHIEKLVSEKKIDVEKDLAHIKKPKDFEKIRKAFEEVYKKEGKMSLTPVFEKLGGEVSYDDLKVGRVFVG
jgi:ATP-dependent exoDNAse (exonuclease V) alpha subunit